jgi:hypothetical protein
MEHVLLKQKTLALSEHTAPQKTGELQYRIFFGVWAIAMLFHMANLKNFTAELHYLLLTIFSILVMFRSGSVILMIALLSLQLFEVFKMMPYVTNHWIFAALVNLTILHALLYQVIKNRSFSIDRAALYNTFAPLLRIELIILYFFVVFHKLNSGFFMPEVSCASEFYLAQNAYSILPNSVNILKLNAYLTIVIEALIPILLCFRKSRNWGLLIGLIFHCVIAYNPINGFYDFSSIIFAVYFVFTSPRFSNKIWETYQLALRKKEEVKQNFPPFSLLTLGVIFLAIAITLGFIQLLTKWDVDIFRHVLWTGFSFTFIGIFILSVFWPDKSSRRPDRSFSIPHLSLLIWPVMVFVCGFAPYLGLKTENSFAMFSNLRTEGGISNHYLMPASMQLFDFQKDLVQVISSTHPELQQLADEEKLQVLFEFKRRMARKRPERVEYLLNGERHTFILSEASPNHELLQGNPFILNKLMRFREISIHEPQPCAH